MAFVNLVAVAIDLSVLLLPNPGNAFITVNPSTGCGTTNVTVAFVLPPGNSYDVTMEFGNATNGYTVFNLNGANNGDTAPFTISETTEFILTQVAYNADPTCSVTFTTPIIETVIISPAPDLVVTGNTTICEGETIDLSTLVSDQNSTGIPITFHSASPPMPSN